MKIQEFINTANKSKFNEYGSFNEGGLQHDILTCLEGKYSGEVIDIYYNWDSGEISKVEYSTQFKGQCPFFYIPQN